MSSKWEDGNIKITFEKSKPGTYTVLLHINELSNASISNPHMIKATSFITNLNIQRVDKNTPLKYSGAYYWYARGNVNPKKVDGDFLYRLPVSPGKDYLVTKHYNVNEKYFGEESTNYHSYQFNAEKGDTVFAVRKGIVMEIEDGADPVASGSNVSYSTQRNSMIIEHEDGTMAWYGVLEKNSFMVKEGDMVYPHTPLALAGTYDMQEYQIRLRIYYLTYDNKVKFSREKGFKTSTEYIAPRFITANGILKLEHGKTYSSAVITEDIITKEMTRKEKKEYGKGQ